MGYQFNGVTKTITLTAGTVNVSVRDVWSRWIDWLLTSDNSKYLLAFKTIGGDVIDNASGTSIPIYAYLQNGWKIKPQESNHTLNINDGILLVDGGGDPFINTIGNFVVRVNYQQPVQAITVSTGGSGGSTPSDVWSYPINAQYTAEEIVKLMSAVLLGKTNGSQSGVETFRDILDTKDSVVSTVTSEGNRTNVSLTP